MRRWLAGLAEILDWWRVYAAVLVALAAAGGILGIVPDAQPALLLAGGAVIIGVVAGILWQARRDRR
jgi:hypothetical protein